MIRSTTGPRESTADLAFASRGLPADWTILRAGQRIGHVLCPDANTAQILATFRYGADVTVRAQGARP
jgi:hypothetical protein